MTTRSHYREAEDTLRRIQDRSPVSQHDIAAAQLHALVAVADELRAIRNEIMTIRAIAAAQTRDDG